jgi:hypothetical protein
MAPTEDDNNNQGLLPAGLMDLLDPVASQNSQANHNHAELFCAIWLSAGKTTACGI